MSIQTIDPCGKLPSLQGPELAQANLTDESLGPSAWLAASRLPEGKPLSSPNKVLRQFSLLGDEGTSHGDGEILEP